MTNETMMAARVQAFGGPDAIEYERVARPEPGPDDVLVRVGAAGFNPSDVGLRAGFLRGVLPVEPPFTPGAEAAGTVVGVGARVEAPAVGDVVVGRLDGGGAMAEYVVAPATELVGVPTGLDLTVAAVVPVAGLTAWQALFEHASVGPGDRVLVNGAGGGVGMFAVQLARHVGAQVIAIVGPRDVDRVVGYGADIVVDRTRQRAQDVLDGAVDVALNLAPVAAPELSALVRPGGTVVSITVPDEARRSDITARHFVARVDTGQLGALLALIGDGTVRVDLGPVWPLSELAAVHRAAETTGLAGKTALVPDPLVAGG